MYKYIYLISNLIPLYLSKINILTIHSIQFMVQHDFEKKIKWSYQEFRGLQMAIKRKALH